MQLARLVHVTEMALAEKENRYMSNSNPGNTMQYNTIQYNTMLRMRRRRLEAQEDITEEKMRCNYHY